MVPWMWFVAALSLSALELLTPGGFWLVFLGIGALVVGLLAITDVLQLAWTQWAAFSVVSILGVLFLRAPLRRQLERSTPARQVDSLVGEEGIVLEAIQPNGLGVAELRGSPWKARTASGAPLEPGRRARVTSIDGLTLVLDA